MKRIIPDSETKLMIKFLTLLTLFILMACEKSAEFKTPAGDTIKTHIVIKFSDQEKGLSGIQESDFGDDEGMLFYYPEDDEKNFWMPDTYFDLDLFYMDEHYKIIDIVRKLPHHVGRADPKSIPRARPIWCRHTLEMKASSPIGQKLKIGDKLEWKDSRLAEEIIKKDL
jgi:uncharacterized membrane protein (UPF0127 family)